MKLGLLTIGDVPATSIVNRAVAAERHEFEWFWIGDERFFREPYQLLALAAKATSQIRLGPCVTDPFSRHPALTSLAIATLDEISNGRAVLVYGAGKSGFPEMGIDRSRSVTAIREATQLVRTLLRQGAADFEGERISFHDGRLNLPTPVDCPIWIASEGTLTLTMAGQVADAVLIGSAANRTGAERAIAAVDRGAERVGRLRPPVHLRIDVAVSDNRAAALDAARPIALRHLIRHLNDPGFVEDHRLCSKLVEQLRGIDYRGYSKDAQRIQDWAAIVPDDLVTPFCWAGTPTDVASACRTIAPLVEGVTIYPLRTGNQNWNEAVTAIAGALKSI